MRRYVSYSVTIIWDAAAFCCDDNDMLHAPLWLAECDHVTRILASDWLLWWLWHAPSFTQSEKLPFHDLTLNIKFESFLQVLQLFSRDCIVWLWVKLVSQVSHRSLYLPWKVASLKCQQLHLALSDIWDDLSAQRIFWGDMLRWTPGHGDIHPQWKLH